MDEETAELLAACKLHIARMAMIHAAYELLYLGTDESEKHYKELLGATKMMRRWELDLRNIAAET